MSLARAQRFLLERLGAGKTAVVAILLDLAQTPAWGDGVDRDGRTIVLVGAHELRQQAPGPAAEAIAAVLASLGDGHVPEGVHAVAYQRAASEAIAEAVAGQAHEVLCWGSRASGKTQLAAGALLTLAEFHARADYALPLRALWLHSSLVDASAKTARSLEEPHWSGVWAMQSDRHVAVATVGGRELVVCDFVGTQDVSTKERLRSSCHVVLAEEIVGTLDEAGGIGEREYQVALTSMLRLEGRKRVAILTTNPGSHEHWAWKRFLADLHDPYRVAMHVPSRDRLSESQIDEQAAPFRDSPDLKARLVEETWTDLKLGPEVAVGFSPRLHVATEPQWLVPQADLIFGWDSSASTLVHATVILQRNGPQVRVFASLVSERTGLRQHIDEKVLPWVQRRAPWILGAASAREWMLHACDPAMLAPSGLDIDETPMRRIRETLGGRFREGQVQWGPSIAPLLAALSPNTEVRLVIDPTPACDIITRALGGLWHFDVSRGGTVERDAPAKNERVFADAGDALCYALSVVTPSKPQRSRQRQHQRSYSTQGDPYGDRARAAQRAYSEGR